MSCQNSGSGDNSGSDSYKDPVVWQYAEWELSYLQISDNHFHFYSSDPEFNCVDQSSVAILNQSGDSYTVDFEGANTTITVSADENTLTISYEDGTQLLFHRANLTVVDLGVSCDNSQATGSVTVSMTMQSLPPTVLINHALTDTGRIEYEWIAAFDLDGDGNASTGDIEFTIRHFKHDVDASTVPLIDLEADAWVRMESGAIRSFLPLDLVINGNTITMSADKSAHIGLSSIHADTPVRFEALHSSPDSGTHSDQYPDNGGYMVPNGVMQDATDDMLGNSSWVDLVEMAVTVD